MSDLVERLEFGAKSNAPSMSFRYGKLIQSHQKLCEEAADRIAELEAELKDYTAAISENQRLRDQSNTYRKALEEIATGFFATHQCIEIARTELKGESDG